jgi:hypothetical protein
VREASSVEIEVTQTYGAELQTKSLMRPAGLASFASYYSLRLVKGIGFLDLDSDQASFAEGNMLWKNSQKADDLPFACTLDFTVGAYSFLMS